MGSIGDVFLRMVADGTGFQADVVRKAGVAGDAAGQTLGQRMGSKMKIAVGSAIGGLLTAGFQIAGKGALELDAATQRLIADTGLVGDEADQARDQLASMYRDNLQGFDQIGEALGKVHTDLGLVGDDAKAVTEQFLKFSTATGQDAAEAVAQADDTLDAFNLTGADAATLLDKLIASHQKYGGVISENEAALAKIAPALGAANLGLDDGIGLLNLFNAAGVDASKAPQALAHALSLVKSPEELQKLLDQISAEPDAFKRAGLATKLFGARAGPQLAQALGKGHLSDFTISMEDAAGATEKAADAVESGFGNRFKLILKNAGGALAEFGTNFGPLVLGFASLLPILTPVLTTLGAAAGGLIAAAIPVGMALLPVLLIAAVVAAIVFLINNPEIVGKIAKFAGEVVGNIIKFLGELPGRLLDFFDRAFGGLPKKVLGIAGDIGRALLTIPAQIVNLPMTIAKVFVDIGGRIIRAVLGFVGDAVRFILSIPGKILGLIGQVGKVATDAAAALLAPFVAVAKEIGKIVSNIGNPNALRGGNVGHDPIGDFLFGTDTPSKLGPVPGVHAAGGIALAGIPALFGEHGPELAVPRVSARVHTAAQTRDLLGQPAGSTFNMPVTVQGLIRARDPFELATQMKRLSSFVTLTPKVEPA